jgi:hypothetical protein
MIILSRKSANSSTHWQLPGNVDQTIKYEVRQNNIQDRVGGQRLVVTIDRLKMAIAKKLKVDEPEAANLAEQVLSYFGFTNVIIDNVIAPADRKLFYRLHDAGLLHSYAESLVLQNGRTWRIFYWEISDDDLKRILRKKEKETKGTYSKLPAEYWSRLGAQA